MIHYYKLLETSDKVFLDLDIVFGVTVQIIKILFGSDNEVINIEKY
jgi:hypothetical protein